jgi:hypothetical protein
MYLGNGTREQAKETGLPKAAERGGGTLMKTPRAIILVAVGGWIGLLAAPPPAAAAAPACPPEVAQAGAMVAKAQDVLQAPTGGGTQQARTPQGSSALGGGPPPQGDPGALAGRTPVMDQGTGTARGLATSAASEISPWSPQPTDKTLVARTTQARTLADQAENLCKAGKMDEAKARAIEAIDILNIPK